MNTHLTKPDIKNLTREALARWFQDHGMRSFRATQVFKWLYLQQVDAFDQMTDLGRKTRALLSQHFSSKRLSLNQVATSKDGTEK